MPPRKSTSSVTPADPDDSLLQSPPAPQTDKPVFATEQQLKARAEAGVSVEVSRSRAGVYIACGIFMRLSTWYGMANMIYYLYLIGLPPPTLIDNPPRKGRPPTEYNHPEGCRASYAKGGDGFCFVFVFTV